MTDEGAVALSHGDVSGWLRRVQRSKSFLRWAGGKQPFLMRYGSRIPRFTGKYIEPFLGSGAVFFFVQRTQARICPAILGDKNLQLILTYLELRDDPQAVVEGLSRLKAEYLASPNPTQYYLDVRARYNSRLPDVKPAEFIFLNRTCWNGLYRVNRKGQFNVPHGTQKNAATFPTDESLYDAAAALRQAQLRATSWEHSVATANEGDFVFLDPPYISDVRSDSTKYSREPFAMSDHRSLAQTLVRLSRRNVDFILTNSFDPELFKIYSEAGHFVEHTIVPRYISSKTNERIATQEMIVRPAGRGVGALRLDLAGP